MKPSKPQPSTPVSPPTLMPRQRLSTREVRAYRRSYHVRLRQLNQSRLTSAQRTQLAKAVISQCKKLRTKRPTSSNSGPASSPSPPSATDLNSHSAQIAVIYNMISYLRAELASMTESSDPFNRIALNAIADIKAFGSFRLPVHPTTALLNRIQDIYPSAQDLYVYRQALEPGFPVHVTTTPQVRLFDTLPEIDNCSTFPTAERRAYRHAFCSSSSRF